MHIAILTFEGYNELDSLIAFGVLNRIRKADWRVSIASPSTPRVHSRGGLVVEAHLSLDEANAADAVVVGSGGRTRELVADDELMTRLQLDPGRQLIGGQCSGTLILAKLGLLAGLPACTDSVTKPWVQEAGIKVLEQAFFAKENVATAGGCLSSVYLAAWIIARLDGVEAATHALHYVAPVGEKDDYVARAMGTISPYLPVTT